MGDMGDGLAIIVDGQKKPEMEQKDDLVKSIKEKLEATTQQSTCCIFRVPKTLSNEKQTAYIPQMISIGPYHHKEQHLKSMDPVKISYLRYFLNRSPQKLENYVEAVTKLGERARQCYSELDEVKTNDLIMMMVVDGGFILGLLLKIMKDDYFNDESNSKLSDFAFVDLILLENQLPFFVLEELYQVFIGDSHGSLADSSPSLRDVINCTLIPLIVGMLVGKDRIESFAAAKKKFTPNDEPKHLLDLVRQFLIPSPSDLLQKMNFDHEEGKKKKPVATRRATMNLLDCASPCVLQLYIEEDNIPLKKEDSLREYNLVEPMRSATELKRANLKFEENKTPRHLLDIKFDNGVLTIPGMKIDRGTEIVLRNLVIYEQFNNGYSYITEYAAFVDDLIISVKDAELLQGIGIIDTKLGDPGEVARIFDKFVKDVAVPCHYTNHIRRQVEGYCNKLKNKIVGAVLENAFLHAVGFVVFFLTVLQTIFITLTYYA